MFLKDKEKVYSEDGLFVLRTGYSLGTVYFINPETKVNYKLLNYGFCPFDKHFYYDDNIHLPRDFVNYFESCEISSENESIMKECGLITLSDAQNIANQYGLEVKQELEYEEKVKDFTRKLTK